MKRRLRRKELKAREATVATSRERTAVTPDDAGEHVVVLDTPLMPAGESQGGTSITSGLPIRSTPEAVRRAPPPPPTGAPMWRLFLKSLLLHQCLHNPKVRKGRKRGAEKGAHDNIQGIGSRRRIG